MSVSKLCRICLNEQTKSMISVFAKLNEVEVEDQANEIIKQITNKLENGTHLSSTKDLTINDMINVFSSHEVTDTDVFPDKMCTNCIRDLCSAYSFRLRCNDAYRKIKKLLCRDDETYFNGSKYATNERLNLDEHHSVFIKTEEIEEAESDNMQNSHVSSQTNTNENYRYIEELIEVIEVEETEEMDIEDINASDNTEKNDSYGSSDEVVEVYEITGADESELENAVSEEDDGNVSENCVSEEISKTIECGYCPEKFSNINDYATHVTNHKLEHRYEAHSIRHQCPECKKTFMRPNELLRHVLGHSNHPYKCDTCEKVFCNRVLFCLHRKQHIASRTNSLGLDSSVKEMICEHCNREFVNETRFEKHHDLCQKKKMQRFQCKICSREFTTAAQRRRHITFVHEKTNDCRSCGKKFESSRELNEHSKEHASERPFLCSECGWRFKDERGLRNHLLIHTGERPFKCKFCGNRFNRKDTLSTHERAHTGERPHICSTCGKAFTGRKTLVKHIRTHTGERPYQCNYCDKSFAQSNDLKVHIRRHTGERFKCEICDNSFIQMHLLRRHKREVHEIETESSAGVNKND